MWEATTLVGNTLCESPGVKVRLKLRVIVESAETGSPYRKFTMPLPGHLSYPNGCTFLMNHSTDCVTNLFPLIASLIVCRPIWCGFS